MEIKKVELDGKDKLKVFFKFPYGDPQFRQHLDMVREIPMRRFVKTDKSAYWEVPNTGRNIQTLESWGFDLPENIVKPNKPKPLKMPDISGLKCELYGYQKYGVAFIESRKGRALIADEPGLGKTAQVLAWLHTKPKIRPVVIIAPASVKENWAREIEKWTGEKDNVTILSGRRNNGENKSILPNPRGTGIYGDWIIVNYDILPDLIDTFKDEFGVKHRRVRLNTGRLHELKAITPRALVIDECHYIKSPKRNRTKAVVELGKTKSLEAILAISGTPIVSRPIEILTTIKMIEPDLFKNDFAYLMRYCRSRNRRHVKDFTGARNTQELHNILTGSIMLRRKKQEVLNDLPPKRRVVVPVELDNKSEYNKAKTDFIEWVSLNLGVDAAKKILRAEALAKIEHLKQLILKGKYKISVKWIKDFLETGEKLVVFGTHKELILKLVKQFGKQAVKLDGSTNQKDRQLAIDRFQNDPDCKVFIGNMKAAGLGITLTAASNALFLEMGWTPGDHDQAEDRIHRIGQKSGAVIWYLLGSGTIEEDIARLIDNKRRILDSVLDGKTGSGESVLTELLEEAKKGK